MSSSYRSLMKTMSQAGKVAEIFSLAGETFTKLGVLATSLQSSNTQDGGKWDDEEIDMLRKAIGQFGNDIEKISEKIKTKSAMQIKNTLKQKAMQNFNVTPSIRPATNNNLQKIAPQQQQQVPEPQHQVVVKTPAMSTAGQNVGSRPPGLQHIAAKNTVVVQQTGQGIAGALKPTVMTIQGQNFAVKQSMVSIPMQQNIVRPPIVTIAGGQTQMAAKQIGVSSPASIITSQINKSPIKIQQVPRSIGAKTKMDTISVSGMMSLADVQNAATKKVKLDAPNLNILTSALLQQKPMIRSQTPGIPGIVSSQGFQVLMPSSVRPTGIVQQRVADVSVVASNVDIES